MVGTRAEDTLPATPSSVVATLPAAGTTIGRYTVLDKVGSGGMGVVYRAHDPSLDRDVAIKLVRPARMRGRAGVKHRARLLREARALAQLQHQNVIRVYDVGEYGEALFFAMEFVQGMDAAQWLKGERPPWSRIVGVYRAAGRGLSAAHTAGLVHRDFKPANIHVGDDHRVRVLDFGLARDAEDLRIDSESESPRPAGNGANGNDVTTAGVVVGTPAYMAPEQLSGEPADARSDQYSFCLSLWESLFGVLPFKGNDVRSLGFAKAEGDIQKPPADRAVPPALVALLVRGLSVSPQRRFASMPELLRELRGIAETATADAPPPGSNAGQAAGQSKDTTLLPWLACGVASVIAVALWISPPGTQTCHDDDTTTELTDAFRSHFAAGQPELARGVAGELAEHWRARGCPTRSWDWTLLSAPQVES